MTMTAAVVDSIGSGPRDMSGRNGRSARGDRDDWSSLQSTRVRSRKATPQPRT